MPPILLFLGLGLGLAAILLKGGKKPEAPKLPQLPSPPTPPAAERPPNKPNPPVGKPKPAPTPPKEEKAPITLPPGTIDVIVPPKAPEAEHPLSKLPELASKPEMVTKPIADTIAKMVRVAKESNQTKAARIAAARSAALNALVRDIKNNEIPNFYLVSLGKKFLNTEVIPYREYPASDIKKVDGQTGMGVVVFKTTIDKKLKEPPVYVSPTLGMP